MSAQVLLIEDNPGDVRLAREAFHGAKIASHLHVVYDGVEALDFLRHEGTHTSAPRPDLILLDLNLPDIHGYEVILLLQTDEKTRKIPVVVISADAMSLQIKKMLEAGARNYLTKPLDLTNFLVEVDKWVG